MSTDLLQKSACNQVLIMSTDLLRKSACDQVWQYSLNHFFDLFCFSFKI